MGALKDPWPLQREIGCQRLAAIIITVFYNFTITTVSVQKCLLRDIEGDLTIQN